ncbi:TolC family protein [Spiribacter onubensis]|uniref:TolC family protein n=1 Tax=Spiribacter onubensis TaxID=3122420 RepID=A0ABV3S803_9GAMM
MTGGRPPLRGSGLAAALIVAGGLVMACPVHSQITSGSVTVLPDAEPTRRPGPGSAETASVPPPPAEPRLLTTTPVGDVEAADAPAEEPTRAREAPRSGVSSEFVGTTRVSPPPAMEAAPPVDAEPGAASRAGSDARTPRQPSRLQAETEIGDEARPSPVITRDVQPRSEPGVVVTEQRFSEPTLEPAPEPAREPRPGIATPEPESPPEPAPAFVTPAPQPSAPPAPRAPAIATPAPAPPAGETPPAVDPDPPAEPERALTEAPRVRFDELPAEGAEIQAYDELLAAGVDATADARSLDELTALQLREWLAQMREAVQDHPSVRVARLQAEASEAGVDQARAARMPQITLSSEIGNERRVRDGEETVSGVTGRDRDLELSPTIDADLLLFDGGAVRAGVDAAEQRVEAGEKRTQAATDTIALRAAQTLIDLATLRAQITLAEENLSEVRRLRAMIQERSEAGRDSPSDMFRMDSRVREAENTLEQRIAAFNAARANYAEVFRSDPIVLGLPPAYAPVPPSASAAIDRAVQRNAELREAQALADAASLDAEARRAERWPQVSLGASVTGYDITREGEDYYDSFFGLRVNAPLFDGGSRRARIDQAQRQAGLEQARVDELRANVVRSVSEAYSARASLRPRLESLRAQVESNRATLEAYEEQFFTGRRPLNDLVTAQRELYAAQADLLDLRGELHLQHFTIRRLTGDLLSEYGLPAGNG